MKIDSILQENEEITFFTSFLRDRLALMKNPSIIVSVFRNQFFYHNCCFVRSSINDEQASQSKTFNNSLSLSKIGMD